MFHQEILTKERIELLPLVTKFSRDFNLVGGTAIALHIGHRESIDFIFSQTFFSLLAMDRQAFQKNFVYS